CGSHFGSRIGAGRRPGAGRYRVPGFAPRPRGTGRSDRYYWSDRAACLLGAHPPRSACPTDRRSASGVIMPIRCSALAFLLAVIMTPAHLPAQSSEPPNGTDKPVEEVFHNIQVFRGMPQSELLPVMHFMRASLGVRCDHCHVAENDMYWKDDKPAKAKARQMIRMVDDINDKNFGGQPVVT